jgi:TonB family protein
MGLTRTAQRAKEGENNIVGAPPRVQLPSTRKAIGRIFLAEGGTPSKFTVSKSTGFATLDQACILAIQQAHFTPAIKSGSAIAAWTYIRISWRLPSQ